MRSAWWPFFGEETTMGLQHISSVGDYTARHVNALAATAVPVSPYQVNTTSTTAVAAPGSVAITPASMSNIQVGDLLGIFGGVGTAEIVQVTSRTATTFTATFANTHSGTYNIVTHKPTRLGAVTINTAGSAIVITLYNGNPSDTTMPVSTIGVLTVGAGIGDVQYHCRAEFGLWYTVTGTTAGDYTITYIDLPL